MGGWYSEGSPVHILEVSCLVSSGFDLRARHLLILRDNCSWEPVCVCAHVCVHVQASSFMSRTHVYLPREAPRSAPTSSPARCEGRKDPKPLPRAIAIYICPGEKAVNYQRLQPSSFSLWGLFIYKSF